MPWGGVPCHESWGPGREGVQRSRAGLEQYRWSSYGQYLGPAESRPAWLGVERVLGNVDLRDDPEGRKRYGEYLEGRVAQLRTAAGKRAFREQWAPIRHGWYVGGEDFGEALLEKLKDRVRDYDRRSYGGEAIRRHDEREAEALIRTGMRKLRLTEQDLQKLPKGHAQKCALADLAHSHTTVSHKWLAQRLCMGHPQNLSLYIKQSRMADTPPPLSSAKRRQARNT